MKRDKAWAPAGDVRRRGARQPRSVIGQLLAVCSVAAVLIGAAATGAYVTAAGQETVVKQLSARYQVIAATVGRLDTVLLSAVLRLQNFALGGSEVKPVSAAEIQAVQSQFSQSMAVLLQEATPDLRILIAAQARAGNVWFDITVWPQLAGVSPGSAAARSLIGPSTRLAASFAAATARLDRRLQTDARALTERSHRVFMTGLAWAGGALAGALVLVLAASLSTIVTVTRPLREVAAAVGRLTAGDFTARAPLAGTAEVREVAQSVNAQAESSRLRALAREAGLQIREHLAAQEVLAATRLALAQIFDEDLVYLRLLQDGGQRLGPPVGVELPARYPARFAAAVLVPTAWLAELRTLFQAQSSLVIQDLAGPDGQNLPPAIGQMLRAAGVPAYVLVPFGVGAEPVGVIVAHRGAAGRPWTLAEIDSMESVAADLGRGLGQARLYEGENQLVADLRALDATKSDFFAITSHELRAPLGTIEGYVEMLADGDAGAITPQQRSMLETIERNSVRLRSLIEDLFTLSKLESGAFTPVSKPIDLAKVIADALAAAQPSAQAAHLSVRAPEPGGPLTVNGDAAQLEQVITNLLSNAIKYTPGGGRIAVIATAEGPHAVIQVTDTGIGISEADQKRLFTRFVRASNAVTRQIPGTGLGLVIVKTIVDRHKGEVAMHSTEGTGTTVTIRLPLAVPGAPNHQAQHPAPASRRQPATATPRAAEPR